MVINEHVSHYKVHASRKEKAMLVKFMISKIEAMGCRFLHQSYNGIWVEAPLDMVKKKVGHGFRDARLAFDGNGDTKNLLPKNFRPAIANHTPLDHMTPPSMAEKKVENEVDDEGECLQRSASNRWPLCVVQQLKNNVSSTRFDHKLVGSTESWTGDEFVSNMPVPDHILSSTVSTQDTSAVSDDMGDTLNMHDFPGESNDYWFDDIPLEMSSLVFEEGENLRQWCRGWT